MTWQSGGGGGIPGVTSDSLVPGGEVIAGALTAGDAVAATVPSFHHFYGLTRFIDTPGNSADDDDTVEIRQQAGLTQNHDGIAFWVKRYGALNGFQYVSPALELDDATATTAPVFQVNKQNVTQFQVDGDGVQVHGKLKTGASATHTLGAYSGKSVPVYDEAGTLLGYMPLYA